MEFKMNDFQLDGKVALITGAVYGIGFEIAKSLAEAGATIVFNNLSPESVEQGLENYRAAGIEARGYVCDVTDEEQVQAMVAQIKEEVGSIDILVNNAGIIKRIPMVDMSAEEFRQVIDVVSAYAAAKGGLKMLTKNIASEYGQYNIQCNGIGPGYIETPQTAPLREPGHPFNEFILGRTPANRWGTPADLAGPAVFLASNASDFVNGHILYVDGGILAYIGKQP